MNMQKLMMEAQKMQREMKKSQEEMEKTDYVGNSSFVSVTLNGNKELKSIKINFEGDLTDDVELLEDMIIVAFNDASKKVDNDKKAKFGKYGSGLSGLI